jgi:hypothetical protein
VEISAVVLESGMAKGWESKAVESQVQEFEERDRGNGKRQLSAADLELQRRREVLLLSRTRVQNELKQSENPRYREQLTRALADIDAQLSAIADI